MWKCIICEIEGIKLTEEHIIPNALSNNVLKSKCICKDCNSKLWSTIDNKFVDSFVIKLKRYQECIKGRNTTENPIKEGIDKKRKED